MALIAAAIAAPGPVLVSIHGQERTVSFDVASVKPSGSESRQGGLTFEPGRFQASGIRLRDLISVAYDITFETPFQTDRISGGPDWVRSERFEVEGKAELSGFSGKARETQMKLMLQSLLADRFKLVLHRETKEMPIYAITVAKGGPKLKKAALEEKDCPEGPIGPSSCHIIKGGMGRGLHSKAANIEDVALYAVGWSDRPLVDKTGLTGLYELDTEGWTPMAPLPQRADGQASAEDTALRDQARPTLAMIFDRLGLKMEPQRGPVEILRIEHAEKPSGN